MNVKHVGLVSGSEKNADKFFGELLGLKKAEPKTLPAALSQALFDVNSDLKVINFLNDQAHFEIFIFGAYKSSQRPIQHVCLEVDDLPSFLQKCRRLDVQILQIRKGDSQLTFISDYDDNLFEIKEKVR
ncbi:MAG: VOC family protein [Candidatus Aminicenantes bacterium]|nr:VOC family protein [Candidatus Aminicenantes bacterium]